MPRLRLSRRQFLLGSAAGASALGLGDTFLVEPRWIRTRRLTFSGAKARFVHITDLHYKGDDRLLQTVVKRINALEPEFVCFTGDLIEQAQHLPGALAGLSEIRAPIYGVPGNHDYWSGADFPQIAQALAATGGAWLEDRSVVLDSHPIQICGSTCNADEKTAPLDGMTNLLLMHYPLHVEKLAPRRYDLILAGHSHGGQIRLPWIGALMVPFRVGKYELGRFSTTAGPLYVNPGIGYFILKARFNCRPEITLFECERA